MMAASLMPMEPLMPIQMSASKNTIYIALQLSNSTWLVAARLPEAEKVVVQRVDARRHHHAARLRRGAARWSSARRRRKSGLLLIANGVSKHIVEPTSILINPRSRCAKMDRLDDQGLLRMLAAHHRDDGQICSVARRAPKKRTRSVRTGNPLP